MTIGESVIRVYLEAVWWLRELAQRLAESCARRVLGPQRGAAMVEYAVLAALVVVGTIAATQALGVSIGGVFDRIRTRLSGLG